MFAEVAEEVRLLLFLQAIPFAVFEKFLLTLKTYLLGERESVLVLSPLCLCPGMQYDVQVQVLPFAVMLDFVFRLPAIAPSVYMTWLPSSSNTGVSVRPR